MRENTDHNMQVIENATLDNVRPGDRITWEETDTDTYLTRTVRREGIAHHRDRFGDWRTEGGQWITDGEGDDVTLTIRRPIPADA